MPLLSRLRHERGQTMSEYALVMGVICLAVFAAIGLLSGSVESAINAVGDLLP